MSDIVKADGIVIYHKLGGAFYPLACGTSATINITADKIELAPYSSGKWRSYEYGRVTGTISTSGLIKINAGASAYGPLELLDFQLSFLKVLTKYVISDPTFIQTAPDPGGIDVEAWEYNATGGETTISNASIINDEVLDVRRNGIGLEIISVGTPWS